METREILKQLREKNNLTQEQMAEQVMVTRQAVSRWENGEMQPNTDTLKIISKKFGISINSLLGSPRHLICQCCGMPLNEDEMIDFLVGHLPNPEGLSEGERRKQYNHYLSQLKHWR